MKHSILVVGGGGREHALAWKLVQSPLVGDLFVAPGNAGTAAIATNVPIGSDDLAGLLAFARRQQVDLTVVGPEAPLANGIVDQFQAAGLRIFGPTQAAAQLEASKAFAKSLMADLDIPTAAFGTFSDYAAAREYVTERITPAGIVIKASGLAAGKGVIVAATLSEADAALQSIMLQNAFGDAGETVVIEERLSGPEASLLAFSDGSSVAALVPARDHKRVYDHDQGPNTGGMGAFAPPPDVTAAMVAEMVRTSIQPVVTAMAARGTPFVGLLFTGFILTPAGPRVLEYNCRFGDPETQAVLPLLKTDLFPILNACVDGTLASLAVEFHPGACAAVVLASPGYPGSYPKGLPIKGVLGGSAREDTLLFHAATTISSGVLTTNGGRVLAVSATAPSLDRAVEKAYAGVEQIHFPGMHYRHDIGR